MSSCVFMENEFFFATMAMKTSNDSFIETKKILCTVFQNIFLFYKEEEHNNYEIQEQQLFEDERELINRFFDLFFIFLFIKYFQMYCKDIIITLQAIYYNIQ